MTGMKECWACFISFLSTGSVRLFWFSSPLKQCTDEKLEWKNAGYICFTPFLSTRSVRLFWFSSPLKQRTEEKPEWKNTVCITFYSTPINMVSDAFLVQFPFKAVHRFMTIFCPWYWCTLLSLATPQKQVCCSLAYLSAPDTDVP